MPLESFSSQLDHIKGDLLERKQDVTPTSYEEYEMIIRECLLKEDYTYVLECLKNVEKYFNSHYQPKDVLLRIFVETQLAKYQDAEDSLNILDEYMVTLTEQPPSAIAGKHLLFSFISLRLKNYSKAIEYLDKIELANIKSESIECENFQLMIHMIKTVALLSLRDYETGQKEYSMFVNMIKKRGDISDLFISYTNLIDRAIARPDEYFITVSDNPLPAPVPDVNNPKKVELEYKFCIELLSIHDNIVVATCTIKPDLSLGTSGK